LHNFYTLFLSEFPPHRNHPRGPGIKPTHVHACAFSYGVTLGNTGFMILCSYTRPLLGRRRAISHRPHFIPVSRFI
jgi:hypothetical protein